MTDTARLAWTRVIALAATALLLSPATAQEATNTPSATQPSVGRLYLREKFQYLHLSDDPTPRDREIDAFIFNTSLTYGLTPTLSLTFDLPLEAKFERIGLEDRTARTFGLADMSLTAKWRFWQDDPGPIDSFRAAALCGVEIPSGDRGFSSDSWDPYIGGIFMFIHGRHGFTAAARYKFNTGGEAFTDRPGDGVDNALTGNLAYLFRVDPAEYAADTAAATYLTLELTSLYETNGDLEVTLAPGILYEARTFALELTVALPVFQDVDERLETDVLVTFGFRYLF